jgi:4-carboxymuconolactone decarboxylase
MSPSAPRIAPLEPPYAPEVAEHLAATMPAWSKMEPLALFRTWARNLPLAVALRPIGRLVLADGALDPRDREILILRVCALCGAEYEWGVHAVSYPPRLGIPPEKVRASATARADDPLWSGREVLLLRLADELHATSRVGAALWEELAAVFRPEELLELLLVAGFYHAVAFTVNALELPPEPWAARFPG